VRGVQRCRDTHLDPLEEYLTQPSERAVLILRADDLAASSRLAKAVEGRCEVHRFRTPGAGDLLRWVRTFFKREGLGIEEDAAVRLVEVTEGDLYRLRGELEKLAAAHGGEAGKTIGIADLVDLLGDHRAAGVFELADALLDRQREVALGLMRRYLRGGGELLPLIGVLQRNLEGAILVALGQRRGLSWGAAVGQAGLPYPAQAKARRWAEAWGAEKLGRALQKLQQIDADLKIGSPQPELELVQLLLW
jgi:DNA polymerase III delta subunit